MVAAMALVAVLTAELSKMSRWLERQMAVFNVAGRTAVLKELLHWQEQRMAVVEVAGLTAELDGWSRCRKQ